MRGPGAPFGACLAFHAPPSFLGEDVSMLPPTSRLTALTTALRLFVAQHPKRITATLAALALTTGGGAFAVASLGPDASDLPVHQVLEAVAPLAASDADAPLADLQLYRSETVRATDTADTLLARLGVADPAAAAFLRRDPLARQALFTRIGRNVTAQTNARHELQQLTVRWIDSESDTQFRRFVLQRNGDGFAARVESAPLVASTRLAGGVIHSSLFAATDMARIPDAVAIQVAEIFGSDIDFHRALRKGDRFSIVYETLEADGEPMRAGRVLSAEFVNAGKSFQAVWFQEPGSKGAYYGFDGNSRQHAFLASPMAFSRVTSGFGMRFHPLLHQNRGHFGVDYGAPTGTPVRVVGDGVVEFAGVQNGYGNVIFVRHRGDKQTVYAHLSRIDVRKGQSVTQGQNIGAVGATGWATGPHLHFEFRVAGKPEDPLKIARAAEAVPISPASRAAFEQVAQAMRLNLAAAGSLDLVASAQ